MISIIKVMKTIMQRILFENGILMWDQKLSQWWYWMLSRHIASISYFLNSFYCGKNGDQLKLSFKLKWMPHSIVKNIHIIGDFKKAETFEISQKYALALNAVFIALFYSSGMPILLLLASVSLFL